MWTSSYCFVTHAIQINLVSNFERSCNFPHRHKNSSQWPRSRCMEGLGHIPSVQWSAETSHAMIFMSVPVSLRPRLRELMWTQPRRAFSMPGPARRKCYVTTNVKILELVRSHVRTYIKSLDKIRIIVSQSDTHRTQAGREMLFIVCTVPHGMGF